MTRSVCSDDSTSSTISNVKNNPWRPHLRQFNEDECKARKDHLRHIFMIPEETRAKYVRTPPMFYPSGRSEVERCRFHVNKQFDGNRSVIGRAIKNGDPDTRTINAIKRQSYTSHMRPAGTTPKSECGADNPFFPFPTHKVPEKRISERFGFHPNSRTIDYSKFY